jgi:hypothetical protein
MKPKLTTALLGVALVAASLAGLGCAQINALGNLKKLQFQLGTVNNFRLNGVDLSRISSGGQIGPMDMARLGQALMMKTMPVEFTLNVLAKNPNAATAGAAGNQSTNLYLSRLDWRLLIDDRETINGTVNQRLAIPGNGQTTTIPVTMGLDLYKFFGGQGLNDLIGLALAIGGANGSSSRLKLVAKVTVDAPIIGPVTYPNEITIVNTQFSNP